MTPSRGNSSLLDQLHQLGWGMIRFFNSAADQPVLNAELTRSVPADPAKALFRTAQELKAEAIDENGRRVDYASLSQASCYQQLRQITGSLSVCSLKDLGDRDNRLAFWINLYNALILDAIIGYQISGRIPFSLFQRAAYEVCGFRFSADEIEHGVLRGNRPHPAYRLRPFSPHDPRQATVIEPFDPRIHFALNCGARSCPPIAFYSGDQIEAQLEQATASFINGGGAEVDLESSKLTLSPILKWYQSDFGGRQQVLSLVADHLLGESEAQAVRSGQLRIRYSEYDWSVNSFI